MRINWVLANQLALDPLIEISTLKSIGCLWGSWTTWRSCQTDNVICHDMQKADDLINRNFHKSCNFYIPKSFYITLNRPQNVQIYEGDFIHEVENREEIISMHLAASNSDIVLLLGFDWTEQPKNADALLEHKALNYRHLIKHAMLGYPDIQWVAIDHPGPFMELYEEIPNLTQDSLKNVLEIVNA